MTASASSEILGHPKYRSDIDGLRAIAVLSVVGFHAFPNWMSGGFTGVDIFFVISGYLISSIIFGGLQRDNFSFAVFYGRRVKRIFPALSLVLIATYVFGWFALLSNEFSNLGKHIAGGAGFVSNFVLWMESGYFDTAAATKPLLHLWSLGIEEQYYIIWPLLLWLAWKGHLKFYVIVLFVGIGSFVLNIHTVFTDSVAAFYSPLARFWELMIGSTLAYLTMHRGGGIDLLVDRFKHVRSILGFTLICAGLLLLDKDRAFPGWWALLPTLGTALVISAGPQGLLNRLILSNPLLVWFGLISFPLYLWHWPLLVFTRLAETGHPSWTTRVAVVMLATGLAWLTFRFVEKPIRFGENGRFATRALAGLMGGVFLLGLSASYNFPSPRNDSPGIQNLVAAIGDWAYPDGFQKKHGFYYLKGQFPDKTVFWGDSHIEQYGPRIVQMLEHNKEGANSVIFATSQGCPPILGIMEDSAFFKDCPTSRHAALDRIKQGDVKVLVIGGCWNCYFVEEAENPKIDSRGHDYYFLKNGVRHNFRGGDGAELAFTAFRKELVKLSKSRKVYLLLDNPSGANFNPQSFLSGKRLTTFHAQPMSQTTQFPFAEIKLREKLVGMAKDLGIETIDPGVTLCDGNRCARTTANGRPIYKDQNHLRPFFVRQDVGFLDLTVYRRVRQTMSHRTGG